MSTPRQKKDGSFILEEFVPFKLAVLSDAVSKLIARDYSERFGITIPEWRILALVGQYTEVQARTVVEKTPMDKVAVSRAVAALVEKGLLQRVPSQTDRRSAMLSLSASGVEVTRQIQEVALGHDAEVLSVLSEEERASLHLILDKLSDRAKSLSQK